MILLADGAGRSGGAARINGQQPCLLAPPSQMRAPPRRCGAPRPVALHDSRPAGRAPAHPMSLRISGAGMPACGPPQVAPSPPRILRKTAGSRSSHTAALFAGAPRCRRRAGACRLRHVERHRESVQRGVTGAAGRRPAGMHVAALTLDAPFEKPLGPRMSRGCDRPESHISHRPGRRCQSTQWPTQP